MICQRFIQNQKDIPNNVVQARCQFQIVNDVVSFMSHKSMWFHQFPPNPLTPATASPDDFPDLLKGLPTAIPFIGFIHGVFSREGCVETDPSKHHLATQRVFQQPGS